MDRGDGWKVAVHLAEELDHLAAELPEESWRANAPGEPLPQSTAMVIGRRELHVGNDAMDIHIGDVRALDLAGAGGDLAASTMRAQVLDGLGGERVARDIIFRPL